MFRSWWETGHLHLLMRRLTPTNRRPAAPAAPDALQGNNLLATRTPRASTSYSSGNVNKSKSRRSFPMHKPSSDHSSSTHSSTQFTHRSCIVMFVRDGSEKKMCTLSSASMDCINMSPFSPPVHCAKARGTARRASNSPCCQKASSTLSKLFARVAKRCELVFQASWKVSWCSVMHLNRLTWYTSPVSSISTSARKLPKNPSKTPTVRFLRISDARCPCKGRGKRRTSRNALPMSRPKALNFSCSHLFFASRSNGTTSRPFTTS
mmetsp:Transcript_128/g.454  ORF Transcript_128/g.454 Transcript_128/m.454 type:complete len:264 (-) Transcript_128:396-1187(-)